MRIVFINPRTDNPYPKPPLGLLQVATACKVAGHKASIIDADLLKLNYWDLVARVDQVDADVVGLTATTPLIESAQNIACKVKGELGLPVIIGGVHASVFYEELKETGLFDQVVVGEGERAVVQALDYIKTGVNGVVGTHTLYYGDGIPVPYYSLIDVAAYEPRYPHGATTPWTSVHTSRGCPWRCTFCVKAVFGNSYRFMPAGQVYKLLQMLNTVHKVKDVTFYDDEFTHGRKRLVELCNLLIARPLVTWSCEARVNTVGLDGFKLMKEAGCRLVYFGLETGNDKILANLRKDFTIQEARKAVEECNEAGIMTAAYFMLGCPGETVKTIRDTVEFSENLGLGHAQFSICTPLPGSELYETCGASPGNYLGGDARAVLVDEGLAEYVAQVVEGQNTRWRRDW